MNDIILKIVKSSINVIKFDVFIFSSFVANNDKNIQIAGKNNQLKYLKSILAALSSFSISYQDELYKNKLKRLRLLDQLYLFSLHLLVSLVPLVYCLQYSLDMLSI